VSVLANGRYRYLAISIASVVGVLAAWFLVTDVLAAVSPVVLPSPERVWARLLWLLDNRFQGNTLIGHTLASINIVVASWLIALAIGLPLGILMAWFRPLDRMVNPLFQLLRPIPPIAWIPISIVWFGIDAPARIFVVVMAAFPPCVLNAYEGVRAVAPVQIAAARTLPSESFRSARTCSAESSSPRMPTDVAAAYRTPTFSSVSAIRMISSARVGTGWSPSIALARISAESEKAASFRISSARSRSADLSMTPVSPDRPDARCASAFDRSRVPSAVVFVRAGEHPARAASVSDRQMFVAARGMVVSGAQAESVPACGSLSAFGPASS